VTDRGRAELPLLHVDQTPRLRSCSEEVCLRPQEHTHASEHEEGLLGARLMPASLSCSKAHPAGSCQHGPRAQDTLTHLQRYAGALPPPAEERWFVEDVRHRSNRLTLAAGSSRHQETRAAGQQGEGEVGI